MDLVFIAVILVLVLAIGFLFMKLSRFQQEVESYQQSLSSNIKKKFKQLFELTQPVDEETQGYDEGQEYQEGQIIEPKDANSSFRKRIVSQQPEISSTRSPIIPQQVRQFQQLHERPIGLSSPDPHNEYTDNQEFEKVTEIEESGAIEEVEETEEVDEEESEYTEETVEGSEEETEEESDFEVS